MWAAHLIYHGCLSVFFGVLHQGGVVPSVRHLNHLPPDSHVVYWKTFSPPLHLLSQKQTVVDLKGILTVFVCVSFPSLFVKGGGSLADAVAATKVYLIAPLSVVNEDNLSEHSFKQTECWGPHLDTENLPRRWSEMQLCMWKRA